MGDGFDRTQSRKEDIGVEQPQEVQLMQKNPSIVADMTQSSLVLASNQPYGGVANDEDAQVSKMASLDSMEIFP